MPVVDRHPTHNPHPVAARDAMTAGLLAPGSSFDGAFPSASRHVAIAVVVPGYSGGGRAGVPPDFPSAVVATSDVKQLEGREGR